MAQYQIRAGNEWRCEEVLSSRDGMDACSVESLRDQCGGCEFRERKKKLISVCLAIIPKPEGVHREDRLLSSPDEEGTIQTVSTEPVRLP